MAAMRRGVLGGTFDPVHFGHLVLAERSREQMELDKVLWLPAGDPWRKAERPVTAAKHRFEMVRLAIEGRSDFELSILEIEREGPTYTVDTLAVLSEQYPDDELCFLLGQDALEDVPNWRDPERLIALATLAVAARGEERRSPAALDRLVPGLSGRVTWIEMPQLEISATELRRRAAAGQSLRYVTPDAVAAYIHDQRLYSG